MLVPSKLRRQSGAGRECSGCDCRCAKQHTLERCNERRLTLCAEYLRQFPSISEEAEMQPGK
jgi:hypothetical protein